MSAEREKVDQPVRQTSEPKVFEENVVKLLAKKGGLGVENKAAGAGGRRSVLLFPQHTEEPEGEGRQYEKPFQRISSSRVLDE